MLRTLVAVQSYTELYLSIEVNGLTSRNGLSIDGNLNLPRYCCTHHIFKQEVSFAHVRWASAICHHRSELLEP